MCEAGLRVIQYIQKGRRAPNGSVGPYSYISKMQKALYDRQSDGGMLLEDLRLLIGMADHKNLFMIACSFRLHKKHEKEIQDRFQPLPEWYRHFDEDIMEPGKRLDFLLATAFDCELVTLIPFEEGARERTLLKPTDFGEKFLHENRTSMQRLLYGLVVPGVPGRYPLFLDYYQRVLGYLPSRTMTKILCKVAQKLAEVPLGIVYPYRDLYDSNSLGKHMEALLLRMVLRITSCGGMKLHYDSRLGELGLELTPLGHHLLTRQGRLPVERKHLERSLVVKPDYEIVFLQKDLKVEALLAPFAKRIHEGHVGALFRIGRGELHEALERRHKGEELLDILAEHSEKIPQNVEQEIRGWSTEIREVLYRHPHQLIFKNETDALLAVSLCPGLLMHIGETVAEVLQPKEMKKIAERLYKVQLRLRKDL